MPKSWKPEYSVGHNDLDAQHEHILRLTSSLTQADLGDGKETADVLFHHIRRYIEWHFTTEEEVMAAGGYPRIAEHRAEHETCLAVLAGHARRLESTGFVDVKAVALFLNQWLETHCLESDRRFMLYISKLTPPGV